MGGNGDETPTNVLLLAQGQRRGLLFISDRARRNVSDYSPGVLRVYESRRLRDGRRLWLWKQGPGQCHPTVLVYLGLVRVHDERRLLDRVHNYVDLQCS